MTTSPKTGGKKKIPESTFDGVGAFCVFIGYPRSGHSLMGALLDAHPNAVISHELHVMQLVQEGITRSALFEQIVRRSNRQAEKGRRSQSPYGAAYKYDVPTQFQGQYRDLAVIGDKRGGDTTAAIGEDPTLVGRLIELTGVPLRMIHVIRNPYDTLATTHRVREQKVRRAAEERSGLSGWLRGGGDPPDRSRSPIRAYFRRVGLNDDIIRACPERAAVLDVYHEDVTAQPEDEIIRLAEFLGLDPHPDYVRDCAKIVFPNPTERRHERDWGDDEIDEIEAGIARYEWLKRYAGSVRS